MAHKTKDGRWRVRWRDGEQRLSRNFETKGQAERFERDLRLGIVELPEKPSTDPTFAVFAADWVERYCKVEKKESQWIEDASVIKNHLVPAFGHFKLRELRKVRLLELKAKLSCQPSMRRDKAPLKVKTVNNILSLAKKMLATALDWELVDANPFEGVKLFPNQPQEMAYWMPAERDRFYREARRIEQEFAEAVHFACHTGLRWGEIAGLQRYQFDLEKRLLQVSAAYNAKAAKRTTPKNGKFAFVPLNSEAVAILRSRALREPSATVFALEALKHASQRLRRMALKVGVRPIRFHDLRHTYASSLAMAGVDLFTIQKLLRHQSITMTMRYAHLAPGYLREAAESISSKPHEPLSPLVVPSFSKAAPK